MDDPRKSLEFRQLDQADKIRLVLVGFFGLIVLTAPSGSFHSFAVACTTISFAACYAIFTRFVLNWHSTRREGHVHLMAALLLCVDVLCISVFVWAAGPGFSGLAMLLLLVVVFAAAFFSGLELALVVGIVALAYATIGVTVYPTNQVWQSLSGIGATLVVSWISYALAEVARRERAVTDRIVHHLTEGVIMVTRQGQIAVINPRVEHMFGIRASDFIGLNVYDPADASAVAPLADILADVYAGVRAADDIRVRDIRIDDPAPTDVQCITVPFDSGSAETMGWVIVCRDVTAAYGAVRARQEGMAVLAHELRGRIHSLSACAEILTTAADGLPAETHDNLLQVLRSGTKRITRLIERILDASVVENKSIAFKLEPVALDRVAREVCDGLQHTAAEQETALVLEVEGRIPMVTGDQARLDEVLQNLVENALKFTPAGGEIRVSVTADESEVQVTVADTGAGIPADRIEFVFEKFSHGESLNQACAGGSLGLGLYVCREVVRRHGGEIRVTSIEGQGTTFTFCIPTADSSSSVARPPSFASPAPALQPISSASN